MRLDLLQMAASVDRLLGHILQMAANRGLDYLLQMGPNHDLLQTTPNHDRIPGLALVFVGQIAKSNLQLRLPRSQRSAPSTCPTSIGEPVLQRPADASSHPARCYIRSGCRTPVNKTT